MAQPDNFHCVCSVNPRGGGGGSAPRGFFPPAVQEGSAEQQGWAWGLCSAGSVQDPLSLEPRGAACTPSPRGQRLWAVGTGVEGRPRAGRGWRSAEDKASGVGSWVGTGHGGGRLCPQEMLAGGTRANGQQAAQDSRRLGAVLPSTPIHEGLGPRVEPLLTTEGLSLERSPGHLPSTCPCPQSTGATPRPSRGGGGRRLWLQRPEQGEA